MRRAERFELSVENFKRRRALPGVTLLDSDIRSFFDRMVFVKKTRDVVFVPKAKARNR